MLSYSDGSPRQEGAHAVGSEFGLDGVRPHVGAGLVPLGDRLQVVPVTSARRVGEFDEAVIRRADEPAADLPPQRHQVTLGSSLSIAKNTSVAFRAVTACAVTCSGSPDPMPMTWMVRTGPNIIGCVS